MWQGIESGREPPLFEEQCRIVCNHLLEEVPGRIGTDWKHGCLVKECINVLALGCKGLVPLGLCIEAHKSKNTCIIHLLDCINAWVKVYMQISQEKHVGNLQHIAILQKYQRLSDMVVIHNGSQGDTA